MERQNQAHSEGTNTPNLHEQPEISDDEGENSPAATTPTNSEESLNNGYSAASHNHHHNQHPHLNQLNANNTNNNNNNNSNNNSSHSTWTRNQQQRSPDIAPRHGMPPYNVPYTTTSPNENLSAVATDNNQNQPVAYYITPGNMSSELTSLQRGNFEWQAGATSVTAHEENPNWDVTNSSVLPRGIEPNLPNNAVPAYGNASNNITPPPPLPTSSQSYSANSAHQRIPQSHWNPPITPALENPQYQGSVSTDTPMNYGGYHQPQSSNFDASAWQSCHDIPEAEF